MNKMKVFIGKVNIIGSLVSDLKEQIKKPEEKVAKVEKLRETTYTFYITNAQYNNW